MRTPAPATPAPTTRQAIIDAATTLFSERGYSATTVRDIAELAGFSPAMVIKTMGSKADLFAIAAPDAPHLDNDLEDEGIGYRLVRRIVARRDSGESDPWAMATFLIQDSPDPAAARIESRRKYVVFVAEQLGDAENLRRAEYVVCVLLGLANGLRVFEVLADEPAESLIARYGAIVQAMIDEG
ncbi:TetR/AcrR family transcriptional regulator [Tomitella biformata]|uniref:TetR/AcrR family transcriptional regulator n=1 Tax=Tomitella biformata TaxID=630403 RepID=UPI0004BBB6E8|nr:TetR/AcrR family transcriptional regulator [Tomitella biformata]